LSCLNKLTSQITAEKEMRTGSVFTTTNKLNGDVKMIKMQPLWKTVRQLPKILNAELSFDPTIPLLNIYPKEV
jgi:tetrahydromethanopterin S-methyltransferase subunit B